MVANARLGDPISCGDVIAQGSGNCFMNGMPVARVGDLTAGHCYPPVPVLVGIPRFYVNNILAAVVGNPIPTHSCGDDSHNGVVSVGSPNCFAGETGATVQSGSSVIAQYIQTGISSQFAAEQHDDDPGSDPVYVSARQSTVSLSPISKTPTVLETAPTVPRIAVANVLSDCTDIYAVQGTFSPSFQLSPNFTLAMLTTNTLVSNYPLRGQVGLIPSDIVCNLRRLCVNVLEPLYAKYGSNLVINSGFRHGSGTSQHYKGEAVDVSFKNVRTSDAAWARAQEIPSVVPFDQYIFEQNLSVWYHLSYSTNNRSAILTKPRGNQYYAGLQRVSA